MEQAEVGLSDDHALRGVLMLVRGRFSAELVQRGERHLQLRLDRSERGDSTTRRLTSAVAHRRGVTDPRLTADCQHRALAVQRALQQTIELASLGNAPTEGRRC